MISSVCLWIAAAQTPIIQQDLKDVSAAEGKGIKLEVVFSASPAPEVTWFRGVERILPSNLYTVILDWVQMDHVKRIWYLSPMLAAKVQASLRIRAVSPEPPLLAHTSIESRGIFRQKARSLALLNGWACTVKICHFVMTECSKTQIRLTGLKLCSSEKF